MTSFFFKELSPSCFIVLVFLLSCHLCVVSATPIHNFQDGKIDLSSWDFNEDIVQLGGDVNFYWNRFVTPGDFQNYHDEERTISLSKSWDNQEQGCDNYSTNGYATYHFTIIIPKSDVGELFVFKPYHFVAYASRVMVNGELVAGNGSVGKSKVDYAPSRHITSKPFVVDSTVLDVVIWTSNYHHFRGGIICDLELGLAEQMMKSREQDVMLDLMVVICLFSMFCYHFLLYCINKENKIALFFSLMCLDFALEFSLQNAMVFFVLFPQVNFELLLPFQLSFHYLIPPAFAFFLHALYPHEVPKRFRNVVFAISVLLIALLFVADSNVYRFLFKPHMVYISVLILRVFYFLFKAYQNKRSGVNHFIVAFLFIFICGLTDMLEVYEVFESRSLFAPGFIVFVFFLSYLQGRKHEEIYRKNRSLNDDLRLLNSGLEKQVDLRTNALVVANNELQKLAGFKEDMTNMIIHDLKIPLNTIINVERFNGRLSHVKQAGYEILNLVQNILSVYKYENAQIEVSKSKENVVDLIEKATEDILVLAKQKTLFIDYDKESCVFIHVDANLIRRVLVNLLSNAVKYAPVGSTIAIQLDFDSEGDLVFSVSNSGVPIPEKKQELIFEKFGRDIDNQIHNVSSTGLGLAFCKMAVEAHGGKIGVESTKLVTRFFFSLPATVIDQSSTQTIASSPNIELLEADLLYLLPIVLKISQLKVYHSSHIRNLLNQINSSQGAIVQWRKEMEKAVYTCDKLLFDQLLNMVNIKK